MYIPDNLRLCAIAATHSKLTLDLRTFPARHSFNCNPQTPQHTPILFKILHNTKIEKLHLGISLNSLKFKWHYPQRQVYRGLSNQATVHYWNHSVVFIQLMGQAMPSIYLRTSSLVLDKGTTGNPFFSGLQISLKLPN